MCKKVHVLLDRPDAEHAANDTSTCRSPWGRIAQAARDAIALLPKRGGYVVGYRTGACPEDRIPVWTPHRERVFATNAQARVWARILNRAASEGLYTVQYDLQATVNQEE